MPTRVAFALVIGATLAASAAEARDGRRSREPDFIGWGPDIGRNADTAIGGGLAGMGAGWVDAMTNFYADPHIENREYFDDYRRPYHRWRRTDRRR